MIKFIHLTEVDAEIFQMQRTQSFTTAKDTEHADACGMVAKVLVYSEKNLNNLLFSSFGT